MDDRQALTSFAALSQETRLAIVRALVVAGHDGLAAGVIAERNERLSEQSNRHQSISQL